jgi:hypothetical protein
MVAADGRSTLSLGRMNAVAAIPWLLVSAAALAAQPAAVPAHARAADSRFELRSDADESRDLIELLVPFFAKYQFGEALPRGRTEAGLTRAIFRSSFAPNGPPAPALASVTGKSNCVVIDYSLLRPAFGPNPLTRGEEVTLFRTRLREFILGLPTPRPTIRELDSTAPHSCDTAS